MANNPIYTFVDLLNEWSYHHPLPSQWVVEINPIPSSIGQSQGIEGGNFLIDEQIKELEHPDWEVNNALPRLVDDRVIKQDNVSCFFVDSVNLVAENASVTSTSFGGGNINGGIIPGLVSTGRADFTGRPLTIGFRETAHSFADFVIRPWIILAAHLGRIADRNSEIKTNITVYSFGKSYPGENTPQIRKVHRYYGCVPAKLNGIDLKYGEDSMITYSTEWFFDRYSISAPYIPDSAGEREARTGGEPPQTDQELQLDPDLEAYRKRMERVRQDRINGTTTS